MQATGHTRTEHRYDATVLTVAGNIVTKTFDYEDDRDVWLHRKRSQIVGDPILHTRQVRITTRPVYGYRSRVTHHAAPDPLTIDPVTMLGAND